MWFYVDHVYLGHQLAEAAAHDSPRGIISDFYPRWLGARELLLHHRNPYSPDVTRDIQIGYYGRPLDPSRPGDPKDQAAFAYPLYVIFLIAPTITFPFASLRVVVHWLFVLLTVSSVPLWLGALRWRAPLVLNAILVTLTVGTLPVVQGIKLEQLTLLVGAMIAGCALLLASDYLVLAGMLLAFATIKPQLVVLIAAWLVLWAFGDYRRRRRFIWSFALNLITLVVAADFVVPGWIGYFVNAMDAYRQYTGRPVSILAVLTSSSWGLVLSGLLLIVLAITCWRARYVPSSDPAFSRVSSLVLVVTVVVIPMTSLYNQILLLPAVLVLVRYGALLWGKDRLARLACLIVVSLMGWPWLAAMALSLAFLIGPAEVAQKYWAAPLWTSMTLPLGVLLLLVQLTALSLTNPDPSIAKSQVFKSPSV
jgi:hypothetical protein